MNKISRQKIVSVSVLFALLILSFYASITPSAKAAEMTTQQKGLVISSDVLGFDMDKYNVTVKEYPQTAEMSYLGVVPQNSVGYNLTSDTGTVRLFYTFANGKLELLEVLQNDAVKAVSQPRIMDVFAAKSFLTSYQSYTSDSLYGQLCSMLDREDCSSNFTKKTTNVVLEANVTDDCTTFKWYFTANGAVAPYSKFIAVVVKDGSLSAFVDNWQLYSVASTTVNLSQEDAINIALEAARNHSWSLKLEDSSLSLQNLNASNVRWTALLFDGSLSADAKRSEDPLALFPVWRVGIALDKWYGNMYGIQIDVWADTGQIRSVQEAWSSMDPPEGAPVASLAESQSLTSQNNDMAILAAVPIFGIIAVGLAAFSIERRKKYCSRLRKRSFKVGGILICILISSTILLDSLATASATTRGAVVWGSESTGAGAYVPYPGDWVNWRKSRDEIDAQRNAAGNLTVFFYAGGYTGNNGINHQGINTPGSTKNQILSDLYNLNYYNDYVAVVDFDHGVGRDDYAAAPPGEFHYMLEDNTGTLVGPSKDDYTEYPGNGVYDMDILGYSQPGQTIFAFISTCLSADLSEGQGYLEPQWPPYTGRALGMPYAWTGRLVEDKTVSGFSISQYISDDGYDNPDWGQQVYIGFIGGSASLSQPLGLYDCPYYYWVCSFLGHAMYNDQSVIEALNTASVQFHGCIFSGSPLRTGFTPYWWNMSGQWPTSTMAVYGNGNIHLSYYTPPTDVPTPQYVSGPTAGDVDTSYDFSALAGDPYGHAVEYRFDWGDGSGYTETGPCSDGTAASASHSWSYGDFFNVRIQARCANSGWSAWSEPLVINIGNQPVYHWLTVYAVDGSTGYPLYPDIGIDWNYVGTGYASVQVSEGWHDVEMSDPTWNGYGMCWGYLSYFTDGYGNGEDRPIYSDLEIVGVYY